MPFEILVGVKQTYVCYCFDIDHIRDLNEKRSLGMKRKAEADEFVGRRTEGGGDIGDKIGEYVG